MVDFLNRLNVITLTFCKYQDVLKTSQSYDSRCVHTGRFCSVYIQIQMKVRTKTVHENVNKCNPECRSHILVKYDLLYLLSIDF